MKLVLVITLLLGSINLSYSQVQDYMLWTKLGVKGKVTKDLSWDGELNTRIGDKGIETFFPQVGLEYKIYKWLRPSVEYRFIIDKNKYGNYKSSNRLNFNVNLKESISNFGVGFRIRYQYAFNRISNDAYDPDFDQAFRFKPVLDYKIDGTAFTPFVGAELFYDPKFGPNGPGFSKFRLGVGSKINLNGPHALSVKYQYDKKFHDFQNGSRHTLAVSYGYKIKGK